LGRRDQPTDALRDYCQYLSEALRRTNVALSIAEIRWEREGWLRALAKLWRDAKAWRGRWVLVQFTELMWSRRGFPLRLLTVLGVLKARRVRVAMLFHDAGVGKPRRGFNRVRVPVQYWVMRKAYDWAARSVFTVPLEPISWLPSHPRKAALVPVGPNVPSLEDCPRAPASRVAPTTVCVFGVATFPPAQAEEVQAISFAVREATRHVPGLRLVIMGRGAKEAEPALRLGLNSAQLNLEVRGVLPAEEISCLLASSDVLLFPRGPISSRRGSGIAGIACGLPIVAYSGRETGFPLTEAGVVLVPQGDLAALANALVRVLGDSDLRQRMAARSLRAHQQWFCWDSIARRLARVLEEDGAAAEAVAVGLAEAS